MAGNNIPRGPEDLPLKAYVSNHSIVVLIIDIKTKKEIRKEIIDYSDSEARKWLGRLTFFATTNGYMVQTCNEKDYVIE